MVEELIHYNEEKHLATVSDVLSIRCMQATVPFKKRVEAIQAFKKQITVQFNELTERSENIRNLIKQFAVTGDPKVKSRQDFSQNLEFYFDLFPSTKTETLKIIDEEIDFCQKRVQEIQAEKEILVQKMQSVLIESENFLTNQPQKTYSDLTTAVATLRKLPVFGNSLGAPDFEWPLESDLLAMPEDKPIRAVSFNYKKCESDGLCLAGFQVILSNGFRSPLFLAKNTNNFHLQRVDIENGKSIRCIKGQMGFNSNVKEIYMYDEAEKLVAQIVTEKAGGLSTSYLQEGEEVIGVYGTVNKVYDHFDTLGFIVWRPRTC